MCRTYAKNGTLNGLGARMSTNTENKDARPLDQALEDAISRSHLPREEAIYSIQRSAEQKDRREGRTTRLFVAKCMKYLEGIRNDWEEMCGEKFPSSLEDLIQLGVRAGIPYKEMETMPLSELGARIAGWLQHQKDIVREDQARKKWRSWYDPSRGFLDSLKPAQKQAFLQYRSVCQRFDEKIKPAEAYSKLSAEGEMLPEKNTWMRYVRAGIAVVGET